MTRLSLAAGILLYLAPAVARAEIGPELRARVASFLGQPCQTVEDDTAYRRETRRLRERIVAAKARGDSANAIELQKQIIAERCDRIHAWSQLASLLFKNGDDRLALQALELTYDLGSNEIEDHLLGDWTDLGGLRQSELYAASRLAAKLEAARTAVAARLEVARKSLTKAPTSERPDLPLVTRDICPFECCGYGEWTAKEDTTLYADPGSSEAVGVAKAGADVEALTGEVRVTEVLPVLVVYPHEVHATNRGPGEKISLVAGDVIFLLHYVGEGYSHAWHQGRVISVESEYARAHCPHPGPRCWGEHLAPVGERAEPVWWVKIGLPDGTTGWTREAGRFSGMDGCS